MTMEKLKEPMWKRYLVKLQMEDKFAASIPKTKEEITKMLENRMPTKPPANAVPIEELAETVAVEVGAGGEPEFGWATFKRDDNGLYYEGRCVRGHIKDCATQVSKLFSNIPGFKAKVANRVYVETQKIYLLDPIKKEPDGYEQRFIQVITRQGPRSTYKYVDYVIRPRLFFILRLLNDGVIKKEHLDPIFEYGSTHGMGQERSQDYGQYSVVTFEEIK